MSEEKPASQIKTAEAPGDEANGWQGKMDKFMTARRNLEAAAEAIEKAPAVEGGAPSPKGDGETEVRRGEVSAATVGRMLGLVMASDIKLLESKVDLLQTRVNNLLAKMDKLQASLQALATGAELERIEVQMGTLKSALSKAPQVVEPSESTDDASGSTEHFRENIVTNRPSGGKFVSRRKD